jgi:hypothetical protein
MNIIKINNKIEGALPPTVTGNSGYSACFLTPFIKGLSLRLHIFLSHFYFMFVQKMNMIQVILRKFEREIEKGESASHNG